MEDLDTTATENKRKITSFVKAIGIQIAVFITVVYATIQANEIAGWILYAYNVLVCVGIFSFAVIILSPGHIIKAGEMLMSGKEVFTSPRHSVIRGIALMFTMIELPLLITHGFYLTAGLWVIGEVLQFLGVRKMKRLITEDQAVEEIIDDFVQNKLSGLVEIFKEMDEIKVEMNEVEAKLEADSDNKELATELYNLNARLNHNVKLLADMGAEAVNPNDPS